MSEHLYHEKLPGPYSKIGVKRKPEAEDEACSSRKIRTSQASAALEKHCIFCNKVKYHKGNKRSTREELTSCLDI